MESSSVRIFTAACTLARASGLRQRAAIHRSVDEYVNSLPFGDKPSPVAAEVLSSIPYAIETRSKDGENRFIVHRVIDFRSHLDTRLPKHELDLEVFYFCWKAGLRPTIDRVAGSNFAIYANFE